MGTCAWLCLLRDAAATLTLTLTLPRYFYYQFISRAYTHDDGVCVYANTRVINNNKSTYYCEQ